MLWLVLIPMVLVAAAGLVLPLIRPDRTTQIAAMDGAAERLGERLTEIERQAADGEIDAGQARALRLEAERRVLSEARAGQADRPLSRRARTLTAAAVALLTVLGGIGLYGLFGRPDMADHQPEVALTADTPIARMTAALEDRARQTPDDPEILRLLGLAYGEQGRYAEAAEILARAGTLAPEDPRIPAARGEALVQGADGIVSDEALAAFRLAAERAPQDPRVRYFLALRKDQDGDRDGAMDDWIALLDDAPAGAPWVAQVRAFVEGVAAERGVDVSGRLPPETPASPQG